MKLAIASDGKTLESKVSEKAGRAPFYLIVVDKELVEVMKNPFAVGGGGAGFGVAKLLEEKNVASVIGKKLGDNMKSALAERNIQFLETKEESVKDAVDSMD